MKSYNFQVTGMAHYIDNILLLTEEDSDYLLTGKEFIEEYEGRGVVNRNWFDPRLSSQVKLIPEPKNQYDPNAMRVEVAGVHIGYIKSGSCSQVKRLLADGARVELSEIHYGPAKWTYEDDDGQVRIAKRNRPPFAQVTLITGEVEEEPGRTPAKSRKKLSGKRMALRIGLTILGILLALLSIGAFNDSVVAGIIVLVLALASLVIGWWPR